MIQRFYHLLALSVAVSIVSLPSVHAETIKGALAKAYENNSSMNSARAGVRVTDEGVAIAKSGYRPKVSGEANASYSSTKSSAFAGSNRLTTGGFGITISQLLFDGFQTKNNIAAAEAQVLAQRQNLRNTEQNILFDAASAYMDVIRDRKIAAFRKKNLAFLEEQVRAANARFEVGEGTRTDVAQADARRQLAISQLSAAEAQAKSSGAIYRQIVGEEPGKLEPAAPVLNLLPKTIEQSLQASASEHPAILANFHVVDATEFGVKAAEGALLPTLGVEAGVQRNFRDSSPDGFGTNADSTTDTASVGLRLTVPIYQGGKTSATVRQQKEQLGKARIDIDVARDQVRAAVTSAWAQLMAAQAAAVANKQLVSAAQLALEGVIEERKVGQRTTLDVLDAQKDVTDARISLAQSERDVVVASYAVLSASGRLSIKRLGLGVAEHKPEEHYVAVKDKWFGLRTPDGR